MLRQFCQVGRHEFWPDDVSILDALEPEALVTPSQLTDVYLLGLAAYHGGKLATLDNRIPVHAVRGGRDAIEFLLD